MEYLVEGLMKVTWQQMVMYGIGILLIWLAVKKEYEPALLLPMGFGAILVNLPASGVVNQMMPGVGEVRGVIQWLFEVGIERSAALLNWKMVGAVMVPAVVGVGDIDKTDGCEQAAKLAEKF